MKRKDAAPASRGQVTRFRTPALRTLSLRPAARTLLSFRSHKDCTNLLQGDEG